MREDLPCLQKRYHPVFVEGSPSKKVEIVRHGKVLQRQNGCSNAMQTQYFQNPNSITANYNRKFLLRVTN